MVRAKAQPQQGVQRQVHEASDGEERVEFPWQREQRERSNGIENDIEPTPVHAAKKRKWVVETATRALLLNYYSFNYTVIVPTRLGTFKSCL